jgi:protocatechuate 3,4-dioxygenase beta subunit
MNSPLNRYERDRPAIEADPARLKAIHAKIVESLKAVVREFAITQDELHLAGDYLNRLGRAGMCRSLIDVSLAMTSIDATVGQAGGTRRNLEGPFHTKHPPRPLGDLLDRPLEADARRLKLSGTVSDAATGQPMAGVVMDFWQADHQGHYDHDGHHLRGEVTTDSEGRYAISTVIPLDYSDHDHDPIGELYRALGRHNRRAAHIHVKAWRDGRELLTTQLYVPDNPYIDSDYVEGAVSGDLILQLADAGVDEHGNPAYAAGFDFALVDVG